MTVSMSKIQTRAREVRSGTSRAGLFVTFNGRALAEQQRDAPQAGDADDGVDDAGKRRGLSAADVRHQDELEQADQQPVDAAQYGENQGNAVQQSHSLLYLAGIAAGCS